MRTPTLSLSEHNRAYKIAFGLAIFTIVYNAAEGLISTYFGFQDENLTLFGFGSDSFIEVISGLGIAHMILRIQRRPTSNRDEFERRALRITGFSFYTLVLGLVVTSFYTMWNQHQPITTFYGVVISAVSIFVMLNLVSWKKHVGKKLHSDPILADASCTMVCVYMSLILLISSVIYEWVNIPYIDIIGTLTLSYFAFLEGKECFAKSNSEKYCACD
ncbi:MAG: cation transporter [Maribacter sp.]|nr:cation transporter [Maribacter sp.]